MRLYEIDSGELLKEFQAGSDEHLSWISGDIAFSPDGSTLALMNAAPTRQPVVLLDADSLEPRAVQPGGVRSWRWLTQDLTYSRDGRVLAAMLSRVQGTAATTQTTSSWAVVWDSGNPRRPIQRIHVADGSRSLALSPDGRFLYTSGPFIRHDLKTGTSVELGGRPPVYMLAMSPDGTLLAGSGDDSVVLFDTRTGEVRRELPTGSDPGLAGHLLRRQPHGRHHQHGRTGGAGLGGSDRSSCGPDCPWRTRGRKPRSAQTDPRSTRPGVTPPCVNGT